MAARRESTVSRVVMRSERSLVWMWQRKDFKMQRHMAFGGARRTGLHPSVQVEKRARRSQQCASGRLQVLAIRKRLSPEQCSFRYLGLLLAIGSSTAWWRLLVEWIYTFMPHPVGTMLVTQGRTSPGRAPKSFACVRSRLSKVEDTSLAALE